MKLNLMFGLLLIAMVLSPWMGTHSSLVTAAPAAIEPAPGKGTVVKTELKAGGSLAPLKTILNLDGSVNLKTGFRGSLDPAGWQLASSLDGQPRFVSTDNLPAPAAPALAGDEYWDKRLVDGITNPGFEVDVYAVAVSGSDVYVGGAFSRAGGIYANNIARWNNTTHQWYPLGPGVNGTVYTIVVRGTTVYVGGSFKDVGGQPAWSLASWDTAANKWSVIGGSPGLVISGKFIGEVRALAVDGGKLYVGGTFDTAGSLSAKNIAVWNGASWAALNSGLSGIDSTVYALAVSGNDLYAGGFFNSPFNNIAHWDGVAWTGMGDANGTVLALALSGTNLYAGGRFTQAGVTQANHAAVWNGSVWSALGAGTDTEVDTMVLASGGLYAGGNFVHAGNGAAANIAFWSGSDWSALGTGTDRNVLALAASGSDVYAAGTFTYLDNRLVNAIGRWSATDTVSYTLGSSLNGIVNAVAVSGDDVYVGGDFNSAGGIPVNSIAHWNSLTNTWSAMGSGFINCTGGCLHQIIHAIAIKGNDVYAGGEVFTAVGPLGALGRWNSQTNTWTGAYINGCAVPGCFPKVNAIIPQGSGLVVGGLFEDAGCAVCYVGNVAYWDGSNTFNPLTDGVTTGTNGAVYALADDGAGGTWLGGDFSSPRPYLAYFDGSDWFGSGSALNGYVDAIALGSNTLYVGGSFSNAGNSGADRIAQLVMTVGSDWKPLGSSLNGLVDALTWDGTDLLVAGFFPQAGLTGVNYIARWDTVANAWSPIGSGLGSVANAIGVGNKAIYVGGVFTTAGGTPSDFLARWAKTSPVYLALVMK